MEALVTAIALWLSANYSFPSTFDRPHIERVPSAAMATLRYKSLLSATGVENLRAVIGLYEDRTKTIYLSDNWTGTTAAELSILVHEMVHHLQNEAGFRYECPVEREKLAYEAQDKWLGLFGRSIESEFQINGLALLVSTSCAMAIGLH